MSSQKLSAIGFDADDTLWQNEQFFRMTEERFAGLLAEYVDPKVIGERLLAVEKRNLHLYGFGIKGFTLSMVETAIQLTNGRIPGTVIEEILAAGREMLRHPVETLPFARETLERLSGTHRIILITKGDLFDQERKLAESGLGDLFDAVEIVSDKNAATYQRIFRRHGEGPERAMMIGNSLKSDVIPAIEAGGWGVFIPHALTWAVEHAEPPKHAPRFRHLAHLGEVVDLIREIG